MRMLKRRGGWSCCLLVLLMSASALLWTSCVSCPEAPATAIDWPVVPEPVGVELEGETVRMPLDTWLAYVRYMVAVERVRASLE